MTRKVSWIVLGACGLLVPACFEHHTADEQVEIVEPYDDDPAPATGDEEEDADVGDETDEGDYEPVTPRRDAGVDAGVRDAGVRDAGARDSGVRDAGVRDAGARDAGVRDAGARDAGARDAGARDAGARDAGRDAGGGGFLGGGGNPGGAGAQGIVTVLKELFNCDMPGDQLASVVCGVLNQGGFLGGGTTGGQGGFLGGGGR